MQLFQNQKLESALNDFRNILIVSFHRPFLNEKGRGTGAGGGGWGRGGEVGEGGGYQKMGKRVTLFGGSFSHS